jgi:hypothetical protein
MKNYLLKTLSLTFVISIGIFGCKKEEEKDADVLGASEHIYVENADNDLTNIGNQAGWTSGNGLSTYKLIQEENTPFLLSCTDSIKRDTINKKITIYFGNRVCNDGRIRSGAVEYSYSGGLKYKDSLVIISVTPINYYVDGNKISGSKSIINKGRINGNFNWSVTANLQVLKADGSTISWNCNRTKILLNTASVYNDSLKTINWTLARIGITGTAGGTTTDGINFTATINTQLVRDFSCKPDALNPLRSPFISGTLDFNPSSKDNRSIDFGTGNCDLDANVTINGNVYPITLK